MLGAPQRSCPLALAIFDLDHTLLAGDSDHAWGEFACELGLVDAESYGRRNDAFYQDYLEGDLDIAAYLRHALQPLADQSLETAARWHQQFMAEKIEPMILPRGLELLERHREAGDHLLIITATNRFITGPIAQRLGVEDLLACGCEIRDGHYTGEPAGIYTYAEGKVTALRVWLEQTGVELAGSCFYSDSHNDIPLLELVDRPVAVDPDDTLRRHAEARGWEIISLRE
jgi:HAD superfamily hydrolase (TIGR01490 family)